MYCEFIFFILTTYAQIRFNRALCIVNVSGDDIDFGYKVVLIEHYVL